ncbi:MAG: PKD domain-containing protein [Chloroflexi bacterium]|nr:PKD domain-containing protein [Chloroflexota bacterium]
MKNLLRSLLLVVLTITPVSMVFAQSNNAIRDIRWNPVNQYLALAYSDGLVEVIDQDTQTVVYQQLYLAPLYRVSWNPDGTLLAIATVNRVVVVNVGTAQVIYDLEGSSLSGVVDTEAGPQQEVVYSLDWSSGNKLATITTSGALRFWDMTSGQMIVETFVGQAGGITWRNDNSGVLTVSGTRIVEINAQSGTQTLWRSDGGGVDQSASIQWSSDGTLFAVGSIYGELAVWDDSSSSGLPVSYTSDILPSIINIDWNADDSMIATASLDGTVRIYDSSTLDVLQTFTQSDVVRAVTWSSDGTELAFGGATGTLEVKALPIADAGEDQTIFINLLIQGPSGLGRATVTLDGTGSSDPDGTITSYEWYENGVLLGSGATLTRTFFEGTHNVTLLVTDNDGLTRLDGVVITVTKIQT